VLYSTALLLLLINEFLFCSSFAALEVVVCHSASKLVRVVSDRRRQKIEKVASSGDVSARVNNMGVASIESYERVHLSSAVHILKLALNLREIEKVEKLRMKSSRILSVFGGMLLSASKNTAEMVVGVFWLLVYI